MNTPAPASPGEVPGFGLAVAAEALYLANLMLIPGLGFVALLLLWQNQHRKAPALARCHLRQTVRASLIGGALLVGINALIVLTGGYDAPYTWVFVVLYFTACHSTLILFGALGFARALAGRPYVYPLIGSPCDD